MIHQCRNYVTQLIFFPLIQKLRSWQISSFVKYTGSLSTLMINQFRKWDGCIKTLYTIKILKTVGIIRLKFQVIVEDFFLKKSKKKGVFLVLKPGKHLFVANYSCAVIPLSN